MPVPQGIHPEADKSGFFSEKVKTLRSLIGHFAPASPAIV
jgi:hypothetical protein